MEDDRKMKPLHSLNISYVMSVSLSFVDLGGTLVVHVDGRSLSTNDIVHDNFVDILSVFFIAVVLFLSLCLFVV